MKKRNRKSGALFTQRFSYNGNAVIVQGDLESITHLRQTLEFMDKYQKFLKQAVHLLKQFVDNRDLYDIRGHMDDAEAFLERLETIGKIAAPVVTFTVEEEYETVMLNITSEIKKKQELLALYRDQYARQLSPYKEGELYETPKGMFYISEVRASKSKKKDSFGEYIVLGVKCTASDILSDIEQKTPIVLHPNSKWSRLDFNR